MDSFCICLAVCFLAAHGVFAAPECNSEPLAYPSGEITSPGFPRKYKNNMNCKFLFKVPEKYVVEIIFDFFDLQPSKKEKRTDYVKILDGPADSRVTTIFEESIQTPFTFVSSTNQVTLVFVTNKKIRRQGFSASYTQINGPTICEHPYEIPNGDLFCHPVDDDYIYFTHCDVTCYPNFVTVGSEVTNCVNNDWTTTTCDPLPNLIEFCSKDIANAGCPYEPSVLAEYYLQNPDLGDDVEGGSPELTAIFDEVGDELTTDSVLIGRTLQTRTLCPAFLCEYLASKGRFKHHCRDVAEYLRKRKKLNNKQTEKRMHHCFRCQANSCQPIYI